MYLTLTFIIWKILQFLNFYMTFKSDVGYACLYGTVYEKMHYATIFCIRVQSWSSQLFFFPFNVKDLKRRSHKFQNKNFKFGSIVLFCQQQKLLTTSYFSYCSGKIIDKNQVEGGKVHASSWVFGEPSVMAPCGSKSMNSCLYCASSGDRQKTSGAYLHSHSFQHLNP